MVADRVKQLDLFGQSVSFNVAGQGAVNSWLGTVMSILIAALTLLYAHKRMDLLLSFGDTNHQETIKLRPVDD